MLGNLETLTTLAISPHDDGTRLTMYAGKLEGGSRIKRTLATPIMLLFLKFYSPKSMQALLTQIEIDQAKKSSESVETGDSSVEVASMAA